MKSERLKILNEISRLEDTYCSTCTIEMPVGRNDYCFTKCEVGAELKENG